MKKGVLENFAKFTGKHLWFEKCSRTPFLQNSSGRLLLAFPCNFIKMGHCQQCLENPRSSDEYSASRNTNLKSTVQVYHFFLGSVNFQCMFSLVNNVYCQKQPPDQCCSVKKGVLKNFVNFIGKHLCCLKSLFNKVAGRAPILKNICQQLLLHYTRITHCYLSVLLYIQHLLPHHHCYYCDISDVCFWFKWKLQRI